MPELIDRQAVLKKMCETCGYCEKFEKAMRSTHPDFVTEKCNNYKFLAEQPTIEPGMNTAKIAKLCNDIEDVACDIARITMNDVISAESRMIFDKSKEIAAEVSKQPEVKPEVRHGRWIPTEYDSYADGVPVWDKYECSECGHEHSGEEDTLTAFCPNCGARMDATDTNVGGKGGAENV